MTYSTRRAVRATVLPRASIGAVTLLVGLVLLTGCGADEESPGVSGSSATVAPTDPDPDVTAGSISPDGDGEVVDELAEGLGDAGAGVDEALDAVGDDGLNDILGGVLEGTLGASGHTFEDGQLIFDMPGAVEESGSDCIIATTSRDGVGASAEIVLRYAGEDVVCG